MGGVMLDMAALEPVRPWTSCQYGDEGEVFAVGEGWLRPFERFTISANGVLVKMICVESSWFPRRWNGQDVESFLRERVVAAGG